MSILVGSHQSSPAVVRRMMAATTFGLYWSSCRWAGRQQSELLPFSASPTHPPFPFPTSFFVPRSLSLSLSLFLLQSFSVLQPATKGNDGKRTAATRSFNLEVRAEGMCGRAAKPVTLPSRRNGDTFGDSLSLSSVVASTALFFSLFPGKRYRRFVMVGCPLPETVLCFVLLLRYVRQGGGDTRSTDSPIDNRHVNSINESMTGDLIRSASDVVLLMTIPRTTNFVDVTRLDSSRSRMEAKEGSNGHGDVNSDQISHLITPKLSLSCLLHPHAQGPKP
ncbi:hypothetical protein BHE74_00000720 [Ensete ventricosum]|nr:hypothetical protein BHE74_00000720 [Ensete ventricosum]